VLIELVRLFCVVLIELLRLKIMVEQVKCVISKYQRPLKEMAFVPSSCGRDTLEKDGDANKLFLTYLFIDVDLGIQFLKDVGLIRSKVTYNTCGRDMTCCANPKRDGIRWNCRRNCVAVCSESKSIEHVSWFVTVTSLSRLFLTYIRATILPPLSKSIASVQLSSRTRTRSA